MAECLLIRRGGSVLPTLSNPAGASDLLLGKQLIDKDGKVVTGTISSVQGSIVNPGLTDKIACPAGVYTSGDIVVAGDPDLRASNIVIGANIYGISGTANATNFAVVGGTTVPENPNENTIWVNTNVDVTGYVFSSKQPSASEGLVWVHTGIESDVEFNIVGSNDIRIYPLEAFQCINGVFVKVETQSYRSGVWTHWWTGMLYNSGNEFEHVTGGWVKYNASSFTKYSTYLYFHGGWISTANRINLTNFKTLKFTVQNKSSWVNPTLGVGTAQNSQVAKVTIPKGITAWTSYTLDVTGYDGEYYINGNTTATADGTSIMLVELIS